MRLFNVRMPEELIAEIRVTVDRLQRDDPNLSQAEFVRSAVRRAIAEAGNGARSEPDPDRGLEGLERARAQGFHATREIDFADWLHPKLGVPKALIRRAIAAGRVEVGGVPYRRQTIPPFRLGPGVRYEGREV